MPMSGAGPFLRKQLSPNNQRKDAGTQRREELEPAMRKDFRCLITTFNDRAEWYDQIRPGYKESKHNVAQDA